VPHRPFERTLIEWAIHGRDDHQTARFQVVSGALEEAGYQDMIWFLSVAWITGGPVWKLEDDRSEMAFPDGVGEPCGIHARFDAVSEFQKLACIVVGVVRQVFLSLVHCRQDRGESLRVCRRPST
jgi:hypothetical protein